MNGFVKRAALGLGLGTGLVSLVGCTTYRNWVDPCWPERYNAQARASVQEATNTQAYNGHVLDQTIWNYHFERDPKGRPTDVLNPAGIEHLKYLARRRPAPDGHLYLQTANDIVYRPDQPPDQFAQVRGELDSKRIVAVQKFLAAQTNGHAHFVVDVHDPAEVGIAAVPITGTAPPGPLPYPVIGGYQRNWSSFMGVLPGQAGTGASGGSGVSNTGSSGSGAGNSTGSFTTPSVGR
jgi:hypothetical protein